MGLVDTLFLEEAEPDSSRSEHPELCDDRGLEAEAITFPHALCLLLPAEQKSLYQSI